MQQLPVAVAADAIQGGYGKKVGLASSTFSIPAASITAVIGPNGSGKSTLLNLVAGLLPLQSGRLAVLGRTPEAARGRVAFVLQSTNVSPTLPISVEEVVRMARFPTSLSLTRLGPVDRSAIRAAMDLVEISHLRNRSLHELSGGERQRVLVAQGLAQDHDLLLLDEPLIGVDLISAGAIELALGAERSQGRSIVFTTHDLRQAMAADYVLLLAGTLVAAGPPGEALTPANLTSAYAGGGAGFDDPAHQGQDRFHVHFDRSIHLEAPGQDLHGSGSDH